MIHAPVGWTRVPGSKRIERLLQHAPTNYNVRVHSMNENEGPLATLRTRMREARARLGAAGRIAAAEGVAASLEQLPEFLVDTNVAGYWAVAGEVPLHVAVARLRSRDQRYLLPVLAAGKMLRFAPLLPSAELRANRYSIPEPVCSEDALLAPAQLDVVLVPLTAFDRRGGRLGMGGGYYDRSFAFLRQAQRPARPLLVGIGYSFQQVDPMSMQAHDLTLDYIATEKELISCAADTDHA